MFVSCANTHIENLRKSSDQFTPCQAHGRILIPECKGLDSQNSNMGFSASWEFAPVKPQHIQWANEITTERMRLRLSHHDTRLKGSFAKHEYLTSPKPASNSSTNDSTRLVNLPTVHPVLFASVAIFARFALRFPLNVKRFHSL